MPITDTKTVTLSAYAQMVDRLLDLQKRVQAGESTVWCIERLAQEHYELVTALKNLLIRAQALDQSSTHDGLNNCQAIVNARSALRGYTDLPDTTLNKP